MARFLRQATIATIKFGPFVSPTDGITAYTVGGLAAKVASGGGTLTARHSSTATTHDADGYQAVELDATDTATVGRLRVEVPGSAGNYFPVWEDFTVLAPAVYDALLGTAGLSTLNAAGIRAAVGMAAANLDDQLATEADPVAVAVTGNSLTMQVGDPYIATTQVGGWILITKATTGAGQTATITSHTGGSSALGFSGWSAGVTPTGSVITYRVMPAARPAVLGTDAITANSVSAGAVIKIQAGLSTGGSGSGADFDSTEIEDGINARQALSLILAACSGEISGAGTGVIVIKGGGVATNRIQANCDNRGNRTSVTLNIPD
jgi:hypothetical protein